MSESNKLELNITKNGNPVKHAISVSAKITFKSFFQKFKRYTTKSYRLQFFDGNKWQQINENTIRPLLRQYNGQQINVRTDVTQENSVDSSRNSKIQQSQISVSPSENLSSIVQQEDQKKQVSDYSPETLQAEIGTFISNAQETRSEPQSEQQRQRNQSDFSDTIKDIVHAITTFMLQNLQKHYNIVRQKEQALNLGKKCAECSATGREAQIRGPYFLCLVCKQEYTLCADCQARDIDQTLKTHKFKSHPFAKIKRLDQTIKQKSIKTINVNDIPFEQTSQRRPRMAQARPENEEDITNILSKKFEIMYKELLNRSEYHRIALSNPDAIHRLKTSVLHRNNLISGVKEAGPQSENSSVHGYTDQSSFMGTNRSASSQQFSSQSGTLTSKDKLRKLKKLKDMKISQQLIKKYTTGDFQNVNLRQVLLQLTPILGK